MIESIDADDVERIDLVDDFGGAALSNRLKPSIRIASGFRTQVEKRSVFENTWPNFSEQTMERLRQLGFYR